MDHQLMTMKQAALNLFNRLKSQLAATTSAFTTVEELTNETRTAMTEASLQFVHLQSEITQQFEAIETMVTSKKKALLSELQAVKESRQNLLQEHFQQLRSLQTDLQTAMARTEALIREHPRLAEAADKSVDLYSWSKASSDIYSLWQQGVPLSKTLEEMPTAEIIQSTMTVPDHHAQCIISTSHATALKEAVDQLAQLQMSAKPECAMQIFVKGIISHYE